MISKRGSTCGSDCSSARMISGWSSTTRIFTAVPPERRRPCDSGGGHGDHLRNWVRVAHLLLATASFGNPPNRVGNCGTGGLAGSSESRFLLLGDFASQRAKPRVDDRRLIEVAIVRFRRELELIDGALEIALPRVVLTLVLVLHQLLVERGVSTRCDEMQRAVIGEASDL